MGRLRQIAVTIALTFMYSLSHDLHIVAGGNAVDFCGTPVPFAQALVRYEGLWTRQSSGLRPTLYEARFGARGTYPTG